MTEVSSATKKKAELIARSTIYIPKDLKLSVPFDRSTAGPGSSSLSIALTFDNKVVKLAVNRDQNEWFSLDKQNDKFIIRKKGDIFIENVEILPVVYHAPGQAFINIENRCIYNCAFCNLTKTKKEFLQNYDERKFVYFILKALNRNDCTAVALTSGIYPDNSTIIKKMCSIIEKIRKKAPTVPIGVEPCILSKKEIMPLKNAGADEIKINVQIPDKTIFKKICPDFDYDDIFAMLDEAVNIFGKGKVATNLIYGLGESDEIILETIEQLASLGIIPTLRKIRLNDDNKKKIQSVLPYELPNISPERILTLAKGQKKILRNHELNTQTFSTMCHKCGCCDIVPFWDV